jgi:hypothetical protein
LLISANGFDPRPAIFNAHRVVEGDWSLPEHIWGQPLQRGISFRERAGRHGIAKPAPRRIQCVGQLTAAQNDSRLDAVFLDPLSSRRARKACVKSDPFVAGQLARIGWRRPPQQIRIGGIERPSHFPNLARDEIFIGDRADFEGQFGLAFLQIETTATAQKLQRDFWKLSPEPRKRRTEKIAKARRDRQTNVRRL